VRETCVVLCPQTRGSADNQRNKPPFQASVPIHTIDSHSHSAPGMSASQPLFDATIEPDEDPIVNSTSTQFPAGNIGSSGSSRGQGRPVVLTPGPAPANHASGIASNTNNAEMGIVSCSLSGRIAASCFLDILLLDILLLDILQKSGILKSSSHPMVLACLYLFRSAAIAVYVLCGLFTDNYVLSVSHYVLK
jgi:hypothetical protein